MENLYDFYFHFNIYTGEWNAFLTSEVSEYGNQKNGTIVFKDADINKLIDKLKTL